MFLESGDIMQEKSLGKTIFFLILSIVLATIVLVIGYSIAGLVIKSSWNYLAVNLFDNRFGLLGTVFDGAMISLATSWIVEPKWGSCLYPILRTMKISTKCTQRYMVLVCTYIHVS